MARIFTSCRGKTLCVENETECRTSGKPHGAVCSTRRPVHALANFIADTGYANINGFVSHVASKVSKKVAHLTYRKQQALSNGFHRMG